MTKHIRNLLLLTSLAGMLSLAGCSSKYPVNFKVHTEPEGAHVIYKQGNQQWVYLGVTPLDAIEMIDKKALKEKDKMSLKTMRCGYLDQVKEWNNSQLRSEVKEKGIIFWTPRLIRNTEE